MGHCREMENCLARLAALVAVLAVALVHNTVDGMPFMANQPEALVELEGGSPVSEMVAAINHKVKMEEAKERTALKAHHVNSIKAGLNREIDQAADKERLDASSFAQKWGDAVKRRTSTGGKSKKSKGSKAAAKAKVEAMLKESGSDMQTAEKDDGMGDVRESRSSDNKKIHDAISGRESTEEKNADTSVSEMEQLIHEDEKASMVKAGEGAAAPEDPLDQAIDQISVVRHKEHQKVLVAKQLAEAKRSMDLAESDDEEPAEDESFLEEEEEGTPATPPGPNANGKPAAVTTGPPPKKQAPVVHNKKKIPKSEPLAPETPKADTSNLDGALMSVKPNATIDTKQSKPLDVTGSFSKADVDKEISAIEGHMSHGEATAEGEKKIVPWHLRNETNAKKSATVPKKAESKKAATPTLPKSGATPENSAPSNPAPTNSSLYAE